MSAMLSLVSRLFAPRGTVPGLSGWRRARRLRVA
jgi:hypothetical protein